jgi:uncharacterized protein (TIGR03437 family)
MRMPTLAAFLIALAAWQFSAHYLDPGSGIQNKLIAADPAGNLFIVSTLSPEGNKSSVHVTKTDGSGNALAVFDFGGSGFTTPAAAILDGSGNLLIGGTSSSSDFPLVSPFQTTGFAFLTKLDPGLTKILYSTRLGTTQAADTAASSVNAIALDPAGNIYVAGNAGAGLPVTSGAFQTQAPAGSTSEAYGFAAELSPDGSQLLFSTYYTGTSTFSIQCHGFFVCPPPIQTLPRAIAVDPSGNVIIAGTTSDTLPVTPGAFAQQCNCGPANFDGFVAELSPGGTTLKWGTYLPLSNSSGYDASSDGLQPGVSVQAIALDASGNIVLAGYTEATFPTTSGALQPSFPAPPPTSDATYVSPEAGFVAILDPTGSKLLHSTYFGGSVINGPVANQPYSGVAGLAIDSAGAIWLTGGSSIVGLPPSTQPVLGQNYIAALSPDLSTLSALYTVPDGAAGTALALGPQGSIASIGSGAALLTAQAGTGPSILGIAPTVAYGVSDVTAPYELIALYGLNIGPATPLGPQIDSQGDIARTLGGFQVLFDGAPAALLYAGPNQINAIVPANVGTTSPTTALKIVSPAGTLNGPSLFVQQLLPQVFGNIGGFATPALNQDGTINSAVNPAPLGSVVAVWLTGIGSQTGFDNLINFEEGSNLAVSVLGPSGGPGWRSLEVLYAGSAPQQPSGVSQINFVLPTQKYNGLNYMSFEIETNAVTSSTFNIYVK